MTTPLNPTLSELLDQAEADLQAAEFHRWRLDITLPLFRTILEDLHAERPGGLDGYDTTAQLARRLEVLLKASGPPAATSYLTVQEYAERLGVSRSTADRLLAGGHVQGAARKTPGVKNSPWMIPEAAVAQHGESWEAAS